MGHLQEAQSERRGTLLMIRKIKGLVRPYEALEGLIRPYKAS